MIFICCDRTRVQYYSHAYVSPRDINPSTRAHAENSQRDARRTFIPKEKRVSAYATRPRASSYFLPMTDATVHLPLLRFRARATYVCDYKRNESSFAFSMARSSSVLSDARVN